MAIPDFQACMLPLLRLAEDGKNHALKDAASLLADHFQLTDSERSELLPSGQQLIFHNRVAWANTYLKKAGLLLAPRRGSFAITDRGRAVLEQNPAGIDRKFLERFSEFSSFTSKSAAESEVIDQGEQTESAATRTSLESLETAYGQIRADLRNELLERLKVESPALFERIVIELLVKMGYGGSRLDAGQTIGKSGDEGLDGIIKEDRLGLDVIYVQAKRWAAMVGRPEIQKFSGALHGQHASKGIFITTSDLFHDDLYFLLSQQF